MEIERNCVGTDHKDYRQYLDIVLQLRVAAEKPKLFDGTSIEWYDNEEE